MLNLSQIRFCAEECERQQSGEMSVYNMCNALSSMCFINDPTLGNKNPILDHGLVQLLGGMIEPNKNTHGYRKTPVQIGDQILPWENIGRSMDILLTSQLGAEEFYQEFESIHPFIDGNGRVGAILYNYLSGWLEYPNKPPKIDLSKFKSHAENEFVEARGKT